MNPLLRFPTATASTLPATVDATRHAVGSLGDSLRVLSRALAELAHALEQGDQDAADRYWQHVGAAMTRYEADDAEVQAALGWLWAERNMEPTP